MKYANSQLGTLATSSQRLNKLLLLLAGLALLLVSMCYWAMSRVFEEESDNVKFHFAQFLEGIHEHENFLRSSAAAYSSSHQNVVTYVRPTSSKLILQRGDDRAYQVKGLAMSLPFTLLQHKPYSPSEMQGAFSWGIQLTDFYSTFWTRAFYPAPQVFMFSPSTQFSVAIPGTEAMRGKNMLLEGDFLRVAETLYASLLPERQNLSETEVRWMRGPPDLIPGVDTAVAYIGIDLTDDVMPSHSDQGLSILLALLDSSVINDRERLLVRPSSDRFTLISPAGDVLLGKPMDLRHVAEGLSLDRYGLCFVLKSPGQQPWIGAYSISYQTFFRYAKWPLLAVFGLFSLALLIGWRVNCWYRTRIVEPAERANQHLTESEAFNRAILENAPIGLCVVQRTSSKVLVENQRAQEWQGTAELIKLLTLDYSEDEQGEVQIQIAGRHLQVCFVSTRYKGEDVVLCGFNDITRHVDDANLMDQARRSADEASKAKTLFLATMSHEIRTPLYGVLGNLELLGLTDLTERQRAYLSTIDRSSTALFKLISDVLDVAKIEAGQMAVEAVTFCPLDLFEDTIRAYAASATRKGLQILACADGKLPALMCGDPERIRQILNNLLSNAIKFTESGHIAFRVKVTELSASHAALKWQVSDTGKGMSEKELANLFTPFSQVSNSNKAGGAGLGLSICSRLSELMGASLRVVSEPGLGSSFALNIQLPIIAGALPNTDDIDIKGLAVHVRAPLTELEQSLIDWLNSWGAHALPAAQEQTGETVAALVDVSPQAGHSEWALVQHNDKPSHAADVIGYDIRAIGRALTRNQRGTPEPTPAPAPQVPIPFGLRILVAEDNPINRAILQEQLRALGATVTTAKNGDQALQLWTAQVFDLVITDVNMPVLNGYELTRALRQRGAQIPIIGVTANALREEGELCLAAGMSGWLVKPLTLQHLRETLHVCCPLPNAHQALPALTEGDLDNWVTMSPQVTRLFVDTMTDDLAKTEQALHAANTEHVIRYLHRMNGALAAVHAEALSDALSHWEKTLQNTPLNGASTRQLQALLSRIHAVVLSLSASLSP